MPPAQQPPAASGLTADQLKDAVGSLKEDIVKEMDTRFATYEDKFGKVDQISEILTSAQKAQQEELERQRQLKQQQEQSQYTPKSWDQVRQDAANDAYERMKQEQEAERQKQERERQIQTQEERDLDAQLDKDLATLERSGYLPPVHNANDYNDPGVTARRELLSRAAFLETPNLGAVADDLTMAHRANQIWNAEKKTWESAENTLHPLPGKFAPVGNSSINTPTSAFQGPSAAELRNMSMDQLVALAQQRGYGPVPTTSNSPTGF